MIVQTQEVWTLKPTEMVSTNTALRVFSTTTGGGLASAHDKSGDATASNSTS